ncbi:hypothetical protein [Marinimicrobium agarilyticum]|uniref:hypothetical protein n=1 Tax=Marinimicrobium agarilyticum TaxID=306546 RepID=UPI0003FDBF10|nr:hypothetical protein [Marinimicrobium agarilyticum]
MTVDILALRGLTLGLLLFVSGCAFWKTDISRENWPEKAPPRSDFEAEYAADKANQAVQSEREYLLWIKRFYIGWRLYADGWNDLVPEVLSEVNDAELRAELEAQLYEMGQDIASEWAKNTEDRRVHTRHLSVWGNALREAIASGETKEMIAEIARDVDQLMDHTLTIGDITASRYQEFEEDDVFRP